MNFSCLSPDEIKSRYRMASDKRNMIQILCELTLSSTREMKIFLGLEENIVPDKNYYGEFDKDKAFILWQQGLLDSEIASILYCHKTTVCNWRRRRGLETNYGKGKKRRDEKKN